ncbi:MAG: hypothetical protein LC107_10535 [Chitinophagales bacterium]|nr:hypothetical protein [Chitinophagales bacterium]
MKIGKHFFGSLIVLLFSILSCSTLLAQQNLPLKFQSDEIKWSELCWMDGLDSDDQRLYLPIQPIIVEDTIYLFKNFYKTKKLDNIYYGECGYMVKKLNIKSGEKYWELQRVYLEFRNRKIISHSKLSGNNIEVVLYDEINSTGTTWAQSFPAHIVIDSKSGIIIDSNYVNKTDPDLFKLSSRGWDTFIRLIGNSEPTTLKREYGYAQLSRGNTFRKIDHSGYLISIDTVEFPSLKYNAATSRLEQVQNDSIWMIITSKIQNNSAMQVLFSKYDSEMNLDTTYDLSEYFSFPISGSKVFSIDNGYFIGNL